MKKIIWRRNWKTIDELDGWGSYVDGALKLHLI